VLGSRDLRDTPTRDSYVHITMEGPMALCSGVVEVKYAHGGLLRWSVWREGERRRRGITRPVLTSPSLLPVANAEQERTESRHGFSGDPISAVPHFKTTSLTSHSSRSRRSKHGN